MLAVHGQAQEHTRRMRQRRRVRLWQKHQSILFAIHPREIPAASVSFTYTLGLGGITVLAGIVAIVTGILLTFYYVPTPQHAYPSVVFIEDVVSWGSFVRALHYWSAQLMVGSATFHMLRVLFTGAFGRPRRFNWLLGLALLVLTLLWDFSGYVLRWDEAAHWALLVGTNLVRLIPALGESLYLMLVGDLAVGAAALLRFYGWHVVGLTAIVTFGVAYHIFRIHVDGGISHPPRQRRPLVPREVLLYKEAVAALIVLAALTVLSALWPAPLGAGADLNHPPARAEAPWIFLWVQYLLRWLPPFWAGIGIPLGVLTFLALIPWLYPHARAGRWFPREQRGLQWLVAAIGMVIVVLSLLERWTQFGLSR